MLRNARQSKILEIIATKEIETQAELCDELTAQHFAVTQATISRDVKELHLFKVRGSEKRFRYAAICEQEDGISEKMRILFQASVTSIVPVNNLIIIKTLVGNGTNAGSVIDKLNYKDVVGSVSGDDTVLLVCNTAEDATAVCFRLNLLLKG